MDVQPEPVRLISKPGCRSAVITAEEIEETVMAQTHHDLRKGKPGAEPTTNAKIAGHEDKVMPTPPDKENPVNPGVGSKAGMAEGQVTKSN
jgi:hypothetical protein